MRIISGRLRGRKLHTFSGSQIRPTSDRMREAIFNILSKRLQDAVVLDLFAGTGALGIEALSRGAHSVLFVDKDSRSIQLIKKNIETCDILEETRIVRWNIVDSLNCLNASRSFFTLVFMDPPYNRGMIQPTLNHLHDSGILQPSACIVIEHSGHEILPRDMTPFQLEDQRKYGKNLVSFLTYVL